MSLMHLCISINSKTIQMKKITLLVAAVSMLGFNSCKKEEEEPFSDKFKVTMQWKNLFDNIDNTNGGNSVTVPSGSTLIFDSGVGGEEGLGDKTIASYEVTRTTATESKTCKFVGPNFLTFGGMAEPVYENTSYTFTLRTTDGDVATQGPFNITVTNDSSIIAVSIGLNTYSSTSKTFFGTTFKTLSFTHDYDCQIYTSTNFFNPRFIDFGLTSDASNNLYLTAPTLFDSLTVMPENNSYSCAYRKCSFQSYSGPINFSSVVSIFDENTLTYNDLQTGLNITSNSNSILVQNGAHFMFKTAEGKKGIGMFKNVVAGAHTDLLLVYQR